MIPSSNLFGGRGGLLGLVSRDVLGEIPERMKGCRFRVWSNQITLKIPSLIIDAIITLLLNDHIITLHFLAGSEPDQSLMKCL
jgi:hypothetical protein